MRTLTDWYAGDDFMIASLEVLVMISILWSICSTAGWTRRARTCVTTRSWHTRPRPTTRKPC